jgi:IS66 Orf2 like protein
MKKPIEGTIALNDRERWFEARRADVSTLPSDLERSLFFSSEQIVNCYWLNLPRTGKYDWRFIRKPSKRSRQLRIASQPTGGGSYERAACRFLQRGTHTDKGAVFRGSGLLLCAKRLARGRFDWPEEIEGIAKVAISAIQFAALMDGLELTRTRAKLWWRKKVEQAAGNHC